MNAADGPARQSGWRILIAGTGGQGVLTAARLLCDCFVELGHEVVSGQLHGMAQRGGAVQSTVVIEGGISPVIGSGRADYVVGFEPVETARALPLMSSRTVVFMNTAPVIPSDLTQRAVREQEELTYPDVTELVACIRAVAANTFAFDATRRAQEAGSIRALNMVMLGCLLGAASLPTGWGGRLARQSAGALPCTTDRFWDFVSKRMPPASMDTNHHAFLGGVELATTVHVGEGLR